MNLLKKIKKVLKINNNFIKLNENSSKNIKNSLKNLFFYAMIPGLLINYSVWGIFKIPFRFYTFPAYGIFLYLIKSEFMTIWYNLWFRPIPPS